VNGNLTIVPNEGRRQVPRVPETLQRQLTRHDPLLKRRSCGWAKERRMGWMSESNWG
jgi:hypothetical protein